MAKTDKTYSVGEKLHFLGAKLAEVLAQAEQEIDALVKGGTEKLVPLLEFYGEYKEQYEALDEVRKELYKLLEALKCGHIPHTMSEAGVSSMVSDRLGKRFGVSERVSVTIVQGKKEDALKWLKSNGFPAIVQETANASSLAAVARDLLKEQGVSLPEKFFSTHLQPTTSVTTVK